MTFRGRKMDDKSAVDCLQEAGRLSRQAILAGDQTEELRLLRLAVAWMALAKYRVAQEGGDVWLAPKRASVRGEAELVGRATTGM